MENIWKHGIEKSVVCRTLPVSVVRKLSSPKWTYHWVWGVGSKRWNSKQTKPHALSCLQMLVLSSRVASRTMNFNCSHPVASVPGFLDSWQQHCDSYTSIITLPCTIKNGASLHNTNPQHAKLIQARSALLQVCDLTKHQLGSQEAGDERHWSQIL